MLSITELKQKACETIESRKDELVAIAKDILANPESGFKEQKTALLVSNKFDELGISNQTGLALTGVKGRIAGGAGTGPRLDIIGELDSLVVKEHPSADADTGAAHSCGHHCQIGMMLGASMGLLTPEVLAQLSGGSYPSPCPPKSSLRWSNGCNCGKKGR